MRNRNVFVLIVLAFIVAPAIHFFIAGDNARNTQTRNILVGIQAIMGLILIFMYARRSGEKNS